MNHQLPPVDSSRNAWIARLERMARPLLESWAAGELRQRMPIEQQADCAPGRSATAHLEAVGRLAAGIAPWLDCSGLEGDEEALRREFTGLVQAGLSHGCDPNHPDWLGFDQHQQTLVDAAFLAQGLWRGRRALWEPLPQLQQARIIDALRMLRNRKPYFNNWLLFGAMPEAFLMAVGADGDPMRIDYALRQHQQWYLGDGVYGDGPTFHADYYNSFVIQPMQLDLVHAIADNDDYAAQLVPTLRARLSRWAAIQERMIHVDGSWPAIGRSICYRTAAFHGLAQAALLDLLPSGVTPAQVRCALSAACARSLDAPHTYDAQGWLRIGLAGHQPALGESYITTGSCYLASFIFLPLGLPPTDPFWTEPDAPWTSIRLWDLGENVAADHALAD